MVDPPTAMEAPWPTEGEPGASPHRQCREPGTWLTRDQLLRLGRLLPGKPSLLLFFLHVVGQVKTRSRVFTQSRSSILIAISRHQPTALSSTQVDRSNLDHERPIKHSVTRKTRPSQNINGQLEVIHPVASSRNVQAASPTMRPQS